MSCTFAPPTGLAVTVQETVSCLGSTLHCLQLRSCGYGMPQVVFRGTPLLLKSAIKANISLANLSHLSFVF